MCNYPSLVLVQSRKIRPCFTERLLMGRKESNKQTNKPMCNSSNYVIYLASDLKKNHFIGFLEAVFLIILTICLVVKKCFLITRLSRVLAELIFIKGVWSGNCKRIHRQTVQFQMRNFKVQDTSVCYK